MGTPIWRGTTALVFQVESGGLTLADRATSKDVYRGPYSTCIAGVLRRGVYGTSARLGWVVTSSVVESEKGGIGKLTINWEAGGASAYSGFLPLSEFDSAPVELAPRVERNPFFALITRDTVGLAWTAFYGATQAQRTTAWNAIEALTDATQKSLGEKLVQKFQNGNETFYLAGMRYMYVWYSFTVPSLTLGGFRDVPAFASGVGLGSAGWLRLADFLQPAGVNGSVYKVTSTWLAGPVDWDPDLYP